MRGSSMWKIKSDSAQDVNPLQETPQRRGAMDFQSCGWNMRDFPPTNNSSRNIFADRLKLSPRELRPSNRYYTQPVEVNWPPIFKPLTPEMESNSCLPEPQAPRKPVNKRLDRSKLQPKKLSYTAEELTPHSPITDTYNSVYFDGSISYKSVRVFHENSNHQNGTPNRTLVGEQTRSAKDFASVVPRGANGQVHSSNKENDSPVSVPVRRGRRPKHNNVTLVDSSIDRCRKSVPQPNVTKLCQINCYSDWEKEIELLQPQRDVGLWIECCNKQCKKWRYVEEYHDPTKVPKFWYCWMQQNVDKVLATCNAPETQITKEVPSKLLENKYNAGSIVLAHIRNSPWWPAIVCDSPETLTFYKLRSKSLKPYKYFVVFFDNNEFECAWIKTSSLRRFASNSDKAPPKLGKKFQEIYGERLKGSFNLAQEAEHLTIAQRLKKFDYLACFKKFNNLGEEESLSLQENNTEDQLSEMSYSSDIIPATPTTTPQKRRRLCFGN